MKNLAVLCAALMSVTAPFATGKAIVNAIADGAPQPLLEMKAGAEKRLTPSSAQIEVTAATEPAGVVVTIQPGEEGYPGVSLKPAADAARAASAWDLSKFGHVEMRVVNLGEKASSIALRVDNDGDWKDNPWNTESVYLQPGEAGTVTTIFGHAYGQKPGYALKPEAVSNILVFATKSGAVQKFRIESLQAAGPAGEKPPVDPNSIRIKPANGFLLGPGATLEDAQINAKNARATLEKSTLRVVFPANQPDQSVTIKPAQGRWDLRDALQMRVAMKNESSVPLTAKLRLESNGGPSDWASATLEPDSEYEIVVPFFDATPQNLEAKEKPNKINNDAVSSLVIATEPVDTDAGDVATERTLAITAIQADLPALQIPIWLGQRPPVAGDWVKTLDENFNGPLDDSIWSVVGENYWDKQSHFSRDNVLVEGGVAKLRYEKKTGFHNDDPTRNQTDWQSGYLHTFDKWAQRYGYFEARMKLPTAPGLWPAFWMMPDRGRGDDVKNIRQNTSEGGMEFDIMEHLTRWGGNRYNIAMHYDGYGEDHKSIGTDKVYIQPDEEGYITTGLLWLPGQAVFYANGHEVARWESDRISNVPEILMFTLPMGGWDNNALDEKLLPDDFLIDYVRVWQREDLKSDGDGTKPRLEAK